MNSLKTQRVCLYLCTATTDRLDKLRQLFLAKDNVTLVRHALDFLHQKQTGPTPVGSDLPETDTLHHHTSQVRFSVAQLEQLDGLCKRFNEGRGAVVDRAVLLYDRHARALRKRELEAQLASL